MNDKKIAMLDDQSPIKRKVVMKNGKMGLKELELLVYLKKIQQKKKYLK